jgi:hypothetical protein
VTDDDDHDRPLLPGRIETPSHAAPGVELEARELRGNAHVGRSCAPDLSKTLHRGVRRPHQRVAEGGLEGDRSPVAGRAWERFPVEGVAWVSRERCGILRATMQIVEAIPEALQPEVDAALASVES